MTQQTPPVLLAQKVERHIKQTLLEVRAEYEDQQRRDYHVPMLELYTEVENHFRSFGITTEFFNRTVSSMKSAGIVSVWKNPFPARAVINGINRADREVGLSDDAWKMFTKQPKYRSNGEECDHPWHGCTCETKDGFATVMLGALTPATPENGRKS